MWSRKNDYVATIFETGHSNRPQSSFISIIFFCFFRLLVHFCSCCLLPFTQLYVRFVFVTGINAKIYNYLRVYSTLMECGRGRASKKKSLHRDTYSTIHLNRSPHFIFHTVLFIILVKPIFLYAKMQCKTNEWIHRTKILS